MNENIPRENIYRSPPAHRRGQNNMIYMNYITNRNYKQVNNIGLYNNINEAVNNANIRRTMRYNDDIKNKLNKINEEQNQNNANNIVNNNTNYYIDKLNKENIKLRAFLNKIRKEILLKDNEIDGYKEKVKALLNQVKDKNDDLNKKRNVIIKLNEEKEMINNNQKESNNTAFNLMKINLQSCIREKEKYQKENKCLKELIQKFKNLNKNKKNAPKSKYDFQENEKSTEFDNNNIKNVNNAENLIINSFGLTIEGNGDDILLKKDNDIQKLTNIIEELKMKIEVDMNQYRKEIEDINNKKAYMDTIVLKKEQYINELTKNYKKLDEENNILRNELDQKKEEINELKMKINLLTNNGENSLDMNINNYDGKKILEANMRENEELKNKIENINKEKINDENKIEELKEDIEGLNEKFEKEINEKNEIIEKLNAKINELENKYKETRNKNEELIKDNNKLYSDNVKLKKNVNKLNEDLENQQNLKEELETENNKIKDKNDQLINDKNELLQKMISIQDKYNNSQKEIENIKNNNNNLMGQIQNFTEPSGVKFKQSASNTLSKNSKTNNNEINDNEEDSKNINNNKLFGNNNKDDDFDKKENEKLQQKIIALNECIQDLNNQLNSLTDKYKEQKKENNNLKQASQALLEKQKYELEQKDKKEFISPETHFIITKKTYKKLIWYLISTIDPKNQNENDINDYNNYKWVTELILPKTQLSKYNRMEEEEITINDLYSYKKKLKSELNDKNIIINNKEYENKRINNDLQNKTASTSIKGGTFFLNKVLNNDKSNNINKSNSNHNFTNKYNANSCLGGEPMGDVEKYKNLLDKLNDYSERETKFQNEIIKLKSQLKNKEMLQSGMNDIKNISHFYESNFIEDDKDEDKNVIDFLSEVRKPKKKEEKKDEENFLGILNDVPGNESDLDEVKGLKKLITYLKNDIKEKEKLINELMSNIKEIFKELKWSTKNSQRVSNIMKILGYTPEIIKIIIDNKKGYNFDFDIILKK